MVRKIQAGAEQRCQALASPTNAQPGCWHLRWGARKPNSSRIWGLRTGSSRGTPQHQSKRLLHCRRAETTRRAQRKWIWKDSPSPLLGSRYLQEFEGGACPIILAPGGMLTQEVISELLPFFAPENQHPVILRGMRILPPALDKWTLDYLRDQLSSKAKFHAFQAPTELNSFTYFFNDSWHADATAHSCGPPTEELSVSFQEFCKRHQEQRSDMHSYADTSRHYLQDIIMAFDKTGRMTPKEGMKPELTRDLSELDRATLDQLRKLGGLGRLWGSQLFCSGQGALVPIHFDQSQNLHQQLQGRKRWLLFSPDMASSFYPFPMYHPMDLRARVDLEHPDFDRYPKLHEAFRKGLVADLGPGDMLFIPLHWWHHVQSVESTNISLNFWFVFDWESGFADADDMNYPLSPAGEVELGRQVEDYLAKECGAANVDAFLRWASSRQSCGSNLETDAKTWSVTAQYLVGRCMDLLGEVGARWVLEEYLDPRRSMPGWSLPRSQASHLLQLVSLHMHTTAWWPCCRVGYSVAFS